MGALHQDLPQSLPPAIEALKQIAAARGVTPAEVVRQAIATEKFLHWSSADREETLLAAIRR